MTRSLRSFTHNSGFKFDRFCLVGGFTLLELMIVVAVIAIVAAVALPSLTNARMAANESSTLQTLRTLVSANEQYRTRFGGFADSLANIESAGYTDAGFSSGNSKSGYTFSYTGTRWAYSINSNPTTHNSSGRRYFFVDESGVIRADESAQATTTSPPIE